MVKKSGQKKKLRTTKHVSKKQLKVVKARSSAAKKSQKPGRLRRSQKKTSSSRAGVKTGSKGTRGAGRIQQVALKEQVARKEHMAAPKPKSFDSEAQESNRSQIDATLLNSKQASIEKRKDNKIDSAEQGQINLQAGAKASNTASVAQQAQNEPQSLSDTVTKEVAANPPSRPPMRKIIGGKGGPIIVAAKQPASPQPESAQSESKDSAVSSQPKAQDISSVKAFLNVEWESLGQHSNKSVGGASGAKLSPHLSILLDTVRRACQDASQWPFAFARMIAAVPSTVGAYEFLTALLSEELDSAQVGKLLGLDIEQTELLHTIACERLSERFSELCPELSRKWEMVVNGNGTDSRLFIERYVVEGIDKTVQMLIGQVLLRALRGGPSGPGRDVVRTGDTLSIVRFAAPLVSEATN